MEREANRNSKKRQKQGYRPRSAHLTTEVDATNWSEESVLPNLKLKDMAKLNLKTSLKLKSSSGSNKKIESLLNNICKETKESQLCVEKLGKNKRGDNPCSKDSELVYSSALKAFSNEPIVSEEKSKIKISTKKGNKMFMFQSPSRSTTLIRSKTQYLPPIKSQSLPCIAKNDQPINGIHDEVFQTFPLNLKAMKRHMQHLRHRKETTMEQKNRKKYRMRTSHLTSYSYPLSRSSQEKTAMAPNEELIAKLCMLLMSWNEWQEEYFFRTFLKLLSSSQIYFMYAFLMVQLYRDVISLLPEKLSLNILSYLKPRQVIVCSKVSRKWSCLCCHNDLWRQICERKNIIATSPSFFESYHQHQKIKRNWQDGRYTISEFIKQTSITSVDIYEDLLATGSSDKIIRIWKGNRTKCFMMLEGHQKCIWGMQFVSQLLLVSCSNDHTIKIWNLRTGNCTRTILGHDGPVWCLHLQGEYFASGSSDKSAKVWSLRSCSLVRSFNNHPGGVYSLALSSNSKKLFAGTVDKIIRVWDMDMQDYVASFQMGTISTPQAPVSSLFYHKGYLWCACSNDFQVWDMINFKVISTHTDAHKRIECGQLQISNDGRSSKNKNHNEDSLKGQVVTCGKDGKVKIWNLFSSKPLTTILIGDESFNFVQFDDRKITLASHNSQDATVKIINFAVNV